MSGELEGLICCVTGGARGLGAAIARQMASAGAKVIVADILAPEGEDLARSIADAGGTAVFHRLDATSEEQWSTLVNEVEGAFGGLDILVNNAGLIIRKPLSQTSLEEWQRALAVNLTSVFLGMKACRPLLARSQAASIVNISSTAGLIAHLDPSYTASKWAVRGLTKSAAVDFVTDGIRVNSVHPSMIATPLTEAGPPGHIEANRQAIPLGREADPEEIANVVLFLASPLSSYMTGSEVTADGGMTTGGVAHMRARLQREFAEGR